MTKRYQIIKTCLLTICLYLFITAPLCAKEESGFYALNRQNGLSSNCVLQMTQLNDGRMVIVTDVAIDIDPITML